MTKIVVLDGYTLCAGDLDFSALSAFGEVAVYDRTPEDQVVARIGDASVVLINKVRMTREIMQACPNLRYIGVTATGFNVVDTAAATELGVTVTNVPAYSTTAVVQHAIALLLASVSRVAEYDAQVKQGAWVNSRDFCFFTAPMEEVAGKTIGIVGYGNIGRAMARAAQGLGMDVLIYAPHPKQELLLEGMRYGALEDVLSQSDVISLHCPLTEVSKAMINADTIGKMKGGVRVINTARGPLVDSAAMAAALAQGKVACYMADVLDVEPPCADDPLLAAPNTIITPHVAWAPVQTRTRLLNVVVGNVKAFLDGAPRNVVNGK